LNVLFIGNSITLHSPEADVDWYNNWGMAASAQSKDYVHRFIALMDSIEGISLQYSITTASSFETNFWNLVPSVCFAFADTMHPDLIIIELGDNVAPDSALKYHFSVSYSAMLDHLASTHPSARFICATKFWVNAAIDTMIRNAATANGAMVADLSTIPYDTMNYAYTQQHWSNNAVGEHPSDIGMEHIAEVILNAFTPNSRPMPVELTSFTGDAANNCIMLRWNTTTELENLGFDVERKSINSGQLTADSWTGIGFVTGHGTTNAPQSYAFEDKTLPPGTYAYRLKQIDRNGAFTYSQQILVKVEEAARAFSLGQNYPNPFNPTTVISYQLAVSSRVTLTVYDLLGREMATLVKEEKEPGSYSATFDGSKLASGIYLYRLKARQTEGGQAGSFVETKKLLLLK
jgi:hypothetical protein